MSPLIIIKVFSSNPPKMLYFTIKAHFLFKLLHFGLSLISNQSLNLLLQLYIVKFIFKSLLNPILNLLFILNYIKSQVQYFN